MAVFEGFVILFALTNYRKCLQVLNSLAPTNDYI